MTTPHVDVFFALSDPTRLEILRILGVHGPYTTCGLSSAFRISRQAVLKHIRVLERAGLVETKKSGRSVMRSLRTAPLHEATYWLSQRASLWDEKLQALKNYVEG